MITPQHVLLHLTLCEGIGPQFIQQLIAAGNNDLMQIYDWTITDWIHRVNGVSNQKAAHLIEHLRDTQLLERELSLIKKTNAYIVSLADKDYPAALRTIYAPPAVLYYRGSLSTLNNAHALSVIGSRAANNYGVRIIKDFVPDLVAAEFVIVSGGALGADSIAHKETLVAGGKTVAVLGSGLLHLYPRTNLQMFEDIIANDGAVVSSFAMSVQPLAQHFPARNRIIAGLSRGCLVVQAAEKSGTRITANYALQQGREVFVVPGQFDDALSAGCHELARDGATLVTSAAQICAELGVAYAAEQAQTANSEKTSQQTFIAATPSPQDVSPIGRIKAALSTPRSVEEIATQLNLDHDFVQQQLWDLQWQGLAQQDFTGRWQR